MKSNKNTKKIAFIIGSMGGGGAERVISILANSYAEKGWKVDIIMLLHDCCCYNLNNAINLKPICNENKSRIRQLPIWIRSIRNYVTENKPYIIVSFVARINIITILSCIGLDQCIIVSERNDPKLDGRSILVRIATHLLYPFADCVIFQTQWARSCFSSRIQKQSKIIPNPIHVTVDASQTKKKKIVAVGRLAKQKNHVMLINAFKKVYERYPDYKLYIYGEGDLRETLTEQVQQLNLEESVFLPGKVSNVHEEIKDAEFFVLSSNYEGLSNALLEAMMMGLPCISTDCAGSNEVIENEKNGLLVPVGDTNKLAKAMKRLIDDKNLAEKLGKNAKLSSKQYSAEKVIDKWEKVIER